MCGRGVGKMHAAKRKERAGATPRCVAFMCPTFQEAICSQLSDIAKLVVVSLKNLVLGLKKTPERRRKRGVAGDGLYDRFGRGLIRFD